MLKDRLASWRQSAHTATFECASKVIDGRIRDAGTWSGSGNDAQSSKKIQVIVGAWTETAAKALSCPNVIWRSVSGIRARKCALQPFYPGGSSMRSSFVAFLPNPSSHSRRKMVCITLQGDVQEA